MDTSPEKFYDSLLEWEAATEEGVTLTGPPEIEEPEEVPPEDYKVSFDVESHVYLALTSQCSWTQNVNSTSAKAYSVIAFQ